MLVTVTCIIGVAYMVMMLYIHSGWLQLVRTTAQQPGAIHKQNRISIVIPFRNEALHLPALIASLQALKQDEIVKEIIFVDDASTDTGAAYIASCLDQLTLPVKVITLQEDASCTSPKKRAITAGIENAQYEWIALLDADCVVQPLWLATMLKATQDPSVYLVCGPVALLPKKGFLNWWQRQEFQAIQWMSQGAAGLNKPVLCNGANLLLNKQAFMNQHGFKGFWNTASGDDLALLAKFKNNVSFVAAPQAVVNTQACNSTKSYILQRKRWLTKMKGSQFKSATVLGLFVTAVNAYAIGLVGYSFVMPQALSWISFFWMLKIGTDLFCLHRYQKHYTLPTSLLQTTLAGCIYPFYHTLLFVLALDQRPYTWKDRKHR